MSDEQEQPSEARMSLVRQQAERSKALAEVTAASVAAQARAAVESRYLMALKSPRNWMDVRSKLLDACKRPAFAESSRYSRPIGGATIQGPSIRFAEEAIRAMGNIYVEKLVLHDDEEKRLIRVAVTDLEANTSYTEDLLIAKTVERSSVRDGQTVVGTRVNSRGKSVYIVAATEDDLNVKQQAMSSKAIRTGALRQLPSDILEEAMEAADATVRDRDAQDPTKARKRVCDAFFSLGVNPSDLEFFLGHTIEQTTPAELSLLRTLYQALKEGEATWADILETRGKTEGVPKRGTEALKEAVQRHAAHASESAAPAAASASPQTPAAPEAEPPAPAKSSTRSASPKPGAAAPVTGEVVPLVSVAQGKAVWQAMDAAKLKADTRMEILEAVGAADTTTIPADRLDDVMAMVKDAK